MLRAYAKTTSPKQLVQAERLHSVYGIRLYPTKSDGEDQTLRFGRLTRASNWNIHYYYHCYYHYYYYYYYFIFIIINNIIVIVIIISRSSCCYTSRNHAYIILTFKPHFYIVKLGFTGVYIIFLLSAQNMDFGYSLEPPRRGGSNEYP